MKTHLICFGMILFSFSTFAQWQPDVRLTNDPGESYNSYNNTRCIAANGSVVHVIWWDIRDGNREIYYKRSVDNGITWQDDVRLTNNVAWSDYPTIAVSGSIVHVVWTDDRLVSFYPEIYYKRSTDGGLTWGEDVQLTSDPSDPGVPSLAVSGSDVHIAWHDIRNGNWEIYYKSSTDDGLTWKPDTRLTNDPGTSERPSIAVSGLPPNEAVSIAWDDDRDNDKEIYFAHSTDGGTTWQPEVRLTNSVGESEAVCIAAINQNLHIAWVENRDGNSEIYYKKSLDNGSTWQDDMRLTNDPNVSANPSVAVADNNVHIAWMDFPDGNEEIYYKRSINNGDNWEATTRLTNDPANSENACVAVSGTYVHVVWQDTRNVNTDIYYKQNPTGNPVTGLTEYSNWDEGLEVYPNPTSGVFSLQSSVFSQRSAVSGQQSTVVEILDLRGNMLKQWNPGTLEFDITGCPAGVYFVRISSSNSLILKKVVKL